MVNSVQRDTSDAIDAMNQCMTIVEKGVSIADTALDAIIQIDDKVYNTIEMNNQIAIAAVDQTTVSNDISRNIGTISSLSQKSQLQMQDIVESVDDLYGQTERLFELIGTFKMTPSAESQAVLY